MKIVSQNIPRDMASIASDDKVVSTKDKSPTTFLSLPAELRNTIYTLSGNLVSIQTWDAEDFQCACVTETEHSGPNEICYEHVRECMFCHHKDSLSSNPASLSLWVNRNSNYAVAGGKSHGGKAQGGKRFGSKRGASKSNSNKSRQMQSLRSVSFRHDTFDNSSASKHAAHIKNGVEQPALTKVSTQVRKDTLPIFYGNHSFLFTLFDREVDGASILKWVRKIGEENAGMLRTVKIVVRNKDDQKYAENELIRLLKKQGLKTEERDVTILKLPSPYCYCELCVRELLGEVEI